MTMTIKQAAATLALDCRLPSRILTGPRGAWRRGTVEEYPEWWELAAAAQTATTGRAINPAQARDAALNPLWGYYEAGEEAASLSDWGDLDAAPAFVGGYLPPRARLLAYAGWAAFATACKDHAPTAALALALERLAALAALAGVVAGAERPRLRFECGRNGAVAA